MEDIELVDASGFLPGWVSEFCQSLYYSCPIRIPAMGMGLEKHGWAKPHPEPGYSGPQWMPTYAGAVAWYSYCVAHGWNDGQLRFFANEVQRWKRRECTHTNTAEVDDGIRCLSGCPNLRCIECDKDLYIHEESRHVKVSR